MFYRYQSQFSLDNSNPKSAEILLGINSEENRNRPDNFIKNIGKRGRKILTLKLLNEIEALIQVLELKKISINIDILTLIDNQVVSTLLNIPNSLATKIKIEITEEIAVPPSQFLYVNQIMDVLRAKGIIFSMDDFGAAYSTIFRFKHLLFDEVKFDKRFLKAKYDKKEEKEFSFSFDYFKDLNIKIVFEGIETLEDINYLKSYGADDASVLQGYYFEKPQTVDYLL